jgi:hypothetical protein
MTAALTWQADFTVSRFGMRVDANNRKHTSPYTRNTQVVDLIGERWVASFSLAVNSYPMAQRVEAFFAQLRGMDGTVAMWHLARTLPSGTMRGSPTLSATVSQGAQAVLIQSVEGATLKAGDMLGIGGQLVMVSADATANGSGLMTVGLVNRFRQQVVASTAITYNKPTAKFRLATDTGASTVVYGKAIADAIQVEMMEAYP